MFNPHRLVLIVVLCFTALAIAACAAPATSELPTLTRTRKPPSTRTPTLAPSLSAAATPSSGVTAVPTTSETVPTSPTPTATSTAILIPTPSVTPTMLGDCAEIWQSGYYVMANDFKTKSKRFNCMIVQASDVVIDCNGHSIEGLDYQGYAFMIRKYGFPLLQTPNNVEIRNCKAFKGLAGVFAEAGTNIYIHDNDFSNNYDDTDSRRYGMFLGLTEGGGINLDHVQGARIENNTTNNEAIGIDVRNSDTIFIRNNTAVNNSAWGVNLLNTQNSEVAGNTLKDNVRYCTWGSGVVGPGCDAGAIILQDGSDRNVVRNNTITGQNGSGIFIKAHNLRCGDDNVIQNNIITDAMYNAVELGFCTGNQVLGNEITGNGSTYVGISFGFDSDTEIRDNKISNMRNQGIDSWNSRDAIIEGNQITNSREGVLFRWSEWDPKQFGFLAPSPDNYASRNNMITNNILRGNSVAGVHLLNSIQNQITRNTFANNGQNVWIEGKHDGDMVADQ
jgi:parallel beta-helix repeat protein